MASTQINVIPNHDYQRTQFAPTKDSTRENDDEEKRYIQFNDKKESDFLYHKRSHDSRMSRFHSVSTKIFIFDF